MEKSIVIIQKYVRGFLLRIKRLPNILYVIQKFLDSNNIIFSNKNKDGRINSSIDEEKCVKMLLLKYEDRIKIPDIRMWYDVLIYDYYYKWIPVNIKITTMKSSDNIGNLATCVYAYTDECLDFDKKYDNGKMSCILFKKIKEKQFNKNYKKDYFFIVLNKNINEIVINSINGLNVLTPNVNNMPYQVRWNNNKQYKHKPIKECINMFMICIKKCNPSWQELFILNMKNLNIQH